MKKLILGLLAFLTTLFCPNETIAQDVTTEGTEFYVSFMGNGYKDRYVSSYYGYQLDFTWLKTQLIISAKRQCQCTISNPNTGYDTTFQMQANVPYPFDVPIEEAYMELDEHGQALGKGLHISADDTISAYCANIAEHSFDASYILPIEALANDYIVQTYDQTTISGNSYSSPYISFYTSAFVIVATEEGETTVDITPSVQTLDGKPAGNTYSITLNKGQSYQVRSHNDDGSRDLSGTRVTARDCKKIAVFNGNNLTQVPNSGNDSDCIFEQAMPLQSWGKKFVVTSSLGRRYNDLVKITSAHNDNEISITGRSPFILHTGESRTINLGTNEKSCFIEATQSCAVYLYNHSKDPITTPFVEDGLGAPSMVWIAPIEQRISDITFSTFNYESEHETDIDAHYVNIIVGSDDAGDVVLDGNVIDDSLFEAVNGTDEYKFYRTRIGHGAHHLSCEGGFNAHIYGYDVARGYAYMAGSKAAELTTTFTINETTVVDGDTVRDCTLDPLVFKVDANYGNYSVTWDFGDGATSTDEAAQHSYAENGFYVVTIEVEAGETECTEATTQTTTFYIDTRLNADEEFSADACIGQPYSGHGFEEVMIEGDTILIRDLADAQSNPCAGKVVVHVTAHEVDYNGPYEEMECFTGPGVFEKYGISIAYDRPGQYDTIAALPDEYGCESLTEIHLTVAYIVDHAPDIIAECDSYTWQNGVTYHESQNIDDTIPDPETGCYQIKHLRLRILHAPDSCVVRATGYTTAPWVVPGNEFQINAYDFYLDSLDSDYGHYDSVAWQLCVRDAATGQLAEANLNWRLAVSGEKHERCKVYPFNHTNDTVWLRATAFNACDNQGVAHDYWIVCSFYGLDYNGSGAGRFSVVPNPSNGLTELLFDNLVGLAEVKVYDFRGILIESLRADSPSLSYDMRHHPNGVYFFVATSQRGTFAQKVVLAK